MVHMAAVYPRIRVLLRSRQSTPPSANTPKEREGEGDGSVPPAELASPPSPSLVGESLWTEYLSHRRGVYQWPTGSHKVMKGEFLCNPRNLRGARERFGGESVVRTEGIIGWWLSEKLDGVRAIWTGEQLLSRTGETIVTPDWWRAKMPRNVTLDGELYLGRGLQRFGEAAGLTHRVTVDEGLWKRTRFMVFDIPDTPGWTYAQTYTLLRYLVLHGEGGEGVERQERGAWEVVEQSPVRSRADFFLRHREIVTSGGEGVMIRDPQSRWAPGPSHQLLKFKAQIDKHTGELLHCYDDEAIIVGYNPSDKLYRADGSPGLKSLEVEWRDKERFSADPQFSVSGGLTNDLRLGAYEQYFPLGAVVRVLYSELTESEKPRFPRLDF